MNIIAFPKVKRSRIRRSESLKGFRVVTGEPAKIRSLRDLKIDEALGLVWKAPLEIEFDDPIAEGRRNIILRTLLHDGTAYATMWMHRGMTPGKVRYGLKPIAPARQNPSRE